jgi:pyruvate dehydrogenase E2 component (dihydrolipoamide acetyltransferase)
MSQLREFRLPDVGEGLTEADIVAWHVKPGDTVKDGQIIVEIETAKAVVELPTPYSGTVARLLVEEGQTVDVGAPIIAVDVSGGSAPAQPGPEAPAAAASSPAPAPAVPAPAVPAPAAPAPAAAAAAVPSTPEPPERTAVLVGYGVKASSTTRRPRRQTGDPETPRNTEISDISPPGDISDPGNAANPAEPAEPAAPNGGRVAALAKPPVRKLARDLGISLTELTGTGPAGSITRDDVQRAATVSPVLFEHKEKIAAGERIPVRGVRKHMAAAMVSSAFTAPHVTEFLQVDVTGTMDAVRRVRELAEYEGVRVSPLLLVARALLVAVARHPLINSSWDEQAQEIVVHGPVNLGIAVAAERGLIVPNVKDAGALPLPGLAAALQQLTETTRAGKATPADLSGGTITITNVGVFGVDAGTPILTPGESAILAFGQIKDAPWVVDGQLVVRKVCTLSLSFDHRIVDGELGSAVLRDVGSMLEDPVRMLAWT